MLPLYAAMGRTNNSKAAQERETRSQQNIMQRQIRHLPNFAKGYSEITK